LYKKATAPAARKGARARVVIGVRRDEDDRDVPVGHNQLTLEREAVHARQSHIENQARRLVHLLRP
jgi:hypothetical protein